MDDAPTWLLAFDRTLPLFGVALGWIGKTVQDRWQADREHKAKRNERLVEACTRMFQGIQDTTHAIAVLMASIPATTMQHPWAQPELHTNLQAVEEARRRFSLDLMLARLHADKPLRAAIDAIPQTTKPNVNGPYVRQEWDDYSIALTDAAAKVIGALDSQISGA